MSEYLKLPLDENGNLIQNNFRFQSPEELVIISFPKTGKTFSMANVPHFLIGDAEGGTNYFNAANVANLCGYSGKKEFVKVKSGAYIPAGLYETAMECAKANNMKLYWELRMKLDERLPEKEKERIFIDLCQMVNDMPFAIFVGDTITSFQELNWKAALAEYNDRFGKEKTDIKKVDDYGGVQYIRANFIGIKRFVEMNTAPFKIWNGHIKEKKKILSKTQEEISAVDLALDGVLSTTFTSKASAVCAFIRDKDNNCFLDFQKRDESDLGSRPRHLSNQLIKIADPIQPDQLYPTTYWNRIYPELKF